MITKKRVDKAPISGSVPKATEVKVYRGAVAHAELTLGDSNLKIILGFYGDMER